MNDMYQLDPSKRPGALKKLAEHLSALNTQGGIEPIMENDMLSLIINGVLNGEDISRQYPAFHRKLLENPEFRRAFLDTLESIEAESAGEFTPIPNPRTDLNFLTDQTDTPLVKHFGKAKWRATWDRTIEQLQTIFSPPELVYRADPGFSEDPWFTLLREEMKTEDVIYDILLDCTLSAKNEESLSASLNLAITLTNPKGYSGLPLRANLHWGEYRESVLLAEEGRVNFPDIPLGSVFDQVESQLKAGFSLTLETP